MKGEIDSNTIIAGNFNSPLNQWTDLLRQKINKETLALNDMLDKIELIDIHRTFFSSTHGTLSRIDHMLSHKKSK